MIDNYYIIEVLLRAHQEEILNQSKLHHQMKILKSDRRDGESLKHIFQGTRSLFAQKRVNMQPVWKISDPCPTPECQVC